MKSCLKSRASGNFTARVFALAAAIPRGRVTTYVALARALGRPGAARAVGNALGKNKRLVCIPCHRVVTASGAVGGYRAGSAKKRTLLEGEGLEIKNNRIINFKKYIFYPQ